MPASYKKAKPKLAPKYLLHFKRAVRKRLNDEIQKKQLEDVYISLIMWSLFNIMIVQEVAKTAVKTEVKLDDVQKDKEDGTEQLEM